MRARLTMMATSALFIAGAAHGALLTVTGSSTINGLGTVISFSNVAQFDPSLGTLISVSAIFSGTRTASYQVNSATTALPVLPQTGSTTVSLYNAAGSVSAPLVGAGPPALEAAGSFFDYTIGGIGGSLLFPSADLPDFIGTGSFQVVGWLSAAAIPGATEVYHSGGAETDVRLIYNYRAATSVPEPATWASMIAGFGLAGGMARVARRARATTAS